MKLVAVALIALGILCNSILARAEGPVPFSALMQTAGAQPSVPNARDNSAAAPSQPSHSRPMSKGGKAMIGGGIALAAIGGTVVVITGIMHDWASPSRKAALFGGGGAVAATGITLIVLGNHHRRAN